MSSPRDPAGQSVIRDANESDLLKVMQAVVRDYPALKLSSLPSFVPGGGRRIELAVRGDEAGVASAMAFVRAQVARLGYPFTDKPAAPGT